MFYPSKKGEGLIPVAENAENYLVDPLKNPDSYDLLLGEFSERTEEILLTSSK